MWGYSPPLDLKDETHQSNNAKLFNFLSVGARDARHIVKTLSVLNDYTETTINFHMSEINPECIARSVLLLNICLEKDSGLQESCRHYLEILGNTLLTPGTAKFLMNTLYDLIDVVTETNSCPWLNLEHLKYKERDLVEAIFKFWIRAICDGIPIIEYWDQRIRKALGTRYDYREGVFDWDYHMVLQSRKISYLTIHEYRFWRDSGIAFAWVETDPSRANPTLIGNIFPYAQGFLHYAYTGDISNGPYLTWTQDERTENEKLRATDKAEKQMMKTIYRIREREECPENIIAAHRDQSISNGVLATEMPNINIEQETWTPNRERSKNSPDQCSWIDFQNKMKVMFHLTSYLKRYKNKSKWQETFDVIFVAHDMINYITDIIPLMKKEAIIIVESRRYLVEVHKELQNKFRDELLKIAHENDLREIKSFNPFEDDFCRFMKKDTNESIS